MRDPRSALVALLALAGCAGTPETPPPTPPSEPAPPVGETSPLAAITLSRPQRPFPEDSLYPLLVAEFALRRRNYDLALQTYMDVYGLDSSYADVADKLENLGGDDE